MEVDPSQIQSKMATQQQSTVEFFANIAFKDFLVDSQKNPVSEKKVVKVGDHHYQIQLDPEVFDSSDILNIKAEDLRTKSEETLSSRSEHKNDKQNTKQEQQSASHPQSSGYHPGLSFTLSAIKPHDFLNSLPKSLRSFIEETVEIFKKQLGGKADAEYIFKFKELNLDVSLRSEKNKLDISVTFRDNELKETVFNKENQQLLINALQQEFPDDDISIQFFEDFESQFNESNDQQSREQSKQDVQEELDEDENS